MIKVLFWLTISAVLLSACASAPVTGRNQLMLVSEEMAIAESEPVYYQMLKEPAAKGKLDNDPKLNARVKLITGRIIAQAITYRPETANWEWSIHIIDEPKTVNAWAMAGGRMALYTGLVQQVKPTDDELAQVLGHEIAHALAKHTAERMSVAIATSTALAIFGMSQNRTGLALTGAALAAALAIKLPNSRQAETEADRIGIELAARAGYNPEAGPTLWEKMNKVGGSKPLEFLSTHPSSESRIQDLRALVPEMLPFYQQKGERPIYQFKPENEKLRK